jgi:hypothetical protein
MDQDAQRRMAEALAASQPGTGSYAVMGVVYLALIIVGVVSMWKVFTKAGRPGWAAIIPIYNLVVLMGIAGKPGWWVLLMFIPVVNLIILILTYVALAESFGKGGGFAVGLILLGIVFFPILAFGSAEYRGPVAQLPVPA